MDFEPGYIKLHRNGELKNRGDHLLATMECCELCPRRCGKNRLAGESGFCQADHSLVVSACHPHFGEEESLVGQHGSGTIFLSHCSLRCVFCINWQISQGGEGNEISIESLAGMMLDLQQLGCHNINFVTPTHYAPQIILALDIAAANGLKIPVVYNTHGWERVEVLKILSGIVDIYLADIKYSDNAKSIMYSSEADHYFEQTMAALSEMQEQVGVAKLAADDLMRQGLMIRHLVMPNDVSGTRAVIDWIVSNLPQDTYLNLMSQYRPAYQAEQYPEIARRITRREYAVAIHYAQRVGLTNLDIQGYYF